MVVIKFFLLLFLPLQSPKFKYMKAFYTSIAFFLGCITILNAQAPNWLWAQNNGGNSEGYSTSTDANGNVYVSGSYSDASITFGSTVLTNPANGSFNIFIVKYNTSGNVLWAKTSGGDGVTVGYGITTDAAGNVYVTGGYAGYNISFGDSVIGQGGNSTSNGFFIVKYDSSGNTLWAKGTAGNPVSNEGLDEGVSVSTDANGNAYCLGNFNVPSLTIGSTTITNANGNSGDDNMFVVKFDTSGNVLWAQNIGETFAQVNNSIAVDPWGNAYVIGNFSSATLSFGNSTLTKAGNSSYFVAKYSSAGSPLWAQEAENTNDVTSSGVSADGNGNVYVTGVFNSPAITFGSYNLTDDSIGNVFVVKYDSTGNVLWANAASGEIASYGKGIKNDSVGNVYVIGNFGGTSITFGSVTLSNPVPLAGSNLFVVKYDPSGNVILATNPIGSDFGNALSADGDGNVYLTGYFNYPTLIFGNDTLSKVKTSVNNYFIAKLSAAATTGINTVSRADADITIYPNPTTGAIYFKGVQAGYSLQVYNLLGEEISSSIIAQDNYSISLAGAAKGIYFYRVADADNLIQQGKIVLQ